ncbi:TPA: hypothetical protein PCU81_002427 [Staphylococcus aureus]|nr:hypothetical protein [Staphylococcus aureus]
MNNPFFAAANLVLELHAKRAEYTKPMNATSEVQLLAGKLEDLASVAMTVGDRDAGLKLFDGAKYWKQYGKKPTPFTEGETA